MTLTDAITAVEQAANAYQGAATTTNNDQVAAAAIQAKLDAANSQVDQDKAAQATAATSFNSALDALIQSATEAKIATA
jgi:hypothetical protein